MLSRVKIFDHPGQYLSIECTLNGTMGLSIQKEILHLKDRLFTTKHLIYYKGGQP